MILYEIKLISQDNNEILFKSVGRKVVFPPQEIVRKYPKAILYVTTLDSSSQTTDSNTEKSKAA